MINYKNLVSRNYLITSWELWRISIIFCHFFIFLLKLAFQINFLMTFYVFTTCLIVIICSLHRFPVSCTKGWHTTGWLDTGPHGLWCLTNCTRQILHKVRIAALLMLGVSAKQKTVDLKLKVYRWFIHRMLLALQIGIRLLNCKQYKCLMSGILHRIFNMLNDWYFVTLLIWYFLSDLQGVK